MNPHRHLPACLVMCIVFTTALSSAAVNAPGQVPPNEAPEQFLRLGDGQTAFPLLVVASADLYNLPRDIQRIIVLIQAPEHPIPADVLATRPGTLVLVPSFLDAADRRAQPDLPAWRHASWQQGAPSSSGLDGVSSLTVIDGLIDYAEQRRHFPVLREIMLIGQGGGIELLHRYQRDHERPPRASGIAVRYVPLGSEPATSAAQR